MIRIESLHIYPVKSCRGIDLTSFEIGPRGPRFDREWMIVDDETGKFISQREFPQLAAVGTELTTDALYLKLPNAEINVPLHPAKGVPNRNVQVWNANCVGLDEGETPATTFSDFLSKRVRLVRMAPEFARLLPEKYGHPRSQTGFADGFPFLLTSIVSLEELNSRLSSPVPMARFRSNIVISGARAFQEDEWKQIRIGGISFVLPKPSARCAIVNTDQISGARSPEVLKTLAKYRTMDRGILFGQNMIHLVRGRLNEGDELEIQV